MSQQLTIRYEYVVEHAPRLDLRQLGESLIGIERIVSLGLFALDTGRLPKGRERLPFSILAAAPERGSFEIDISLGVWIAAHLLHSLSQDGTPNVLSDWIMGVLYKMAGRENKSQESFDKVLDILADTQKRSDDAHERQLIRHHLETLNWQKMLDPARRVVGPVGESCHKIVLSDDTSVTGLAEAAIDTSLASAIRNSSGAHIGALETLTIRVDGFSHHNRHLKVVHPAQPNQFITARVLDPVFQLVPNVYVTAAANRGYLEVTAKAIRKNGQIQMLYIVDANPAPETSRMS